MSVAVRAITRIQDADDVNVTPGESIDEYALCWDSGTAKFVARQVVGVYLLATGATTGATSQAQAFTNGIVGPSWKPAADSVTALQLQTAAGANVLNVDTTNGRVGVGTAAPATLLHGLLTSAATNAVTNVLTIGHDTSGTAAAGFGAGLLYQLESSTTAAQDAARIAALWTDATHATRASALTFSTLTAGGSLTERMRIDGAGSVGIGTTAPSARLHVQQAADTNTGGLYIVNVGVTRATRIWVDTAPSNALRIDSGSTAEGVVAINGAGAGRVGIGTTAPAARLHVDQSSETGAVPVLTVDQADVSEEFIRFIGNSTTDATRSLVDAADMTTPGSIVGWLKIYVQDDQATNPITDGAYYVPFYSAPTA